MGFVKDRSSQSTGAWSKPHGWARSDLILVPRRGGLRFGKAGVETRPKALISLLFRLCALRCLNSARAIVSLFDREAFLRPDLHIVEGTVRSRSQGWPKATAGGGAQRP